jgi:hypothetical protein
MKMEQQDYLRESAKRRARGQGLVELCAGLVVGIPIVLATMDLGIICLAALINDSVCQQSARAAASGPPAGDQPGPSHSVASNETPYQRTLSVIKRQVPTRMPIKVDENPVLVETIRDFPTPDMGGAVDGEITVATKVTVLPPFVLGNFFSPSGVSLRSSHTVPITYVVPQVPPSQPNSPG